jgi:endonuclease/exonuclease/phosphatase family metal-dependent hydrolase
MARFRVATYNIHKCVGMDRRYSPERIADVLGELDADVIALQEVLCHRHAQKRDDQAEFLAGRLGMDVRLGENRTINEGEYGNAVLTRFPIVDWKNYDITVKRREPRGCLRVSIDLREKQIEFLNLHMGTSYFERRLQVFKLLTEHVIDAPEIVGRRIVAGDFNEWTHGLTTRLFKTNFSSVDPKVHLGRARTFPVLMPLLHLDHVYFDNGIKLTGAFVHRSRKALIASDHSPIVADFEF